jgi:phosphoglycolate phosphatase-like HAD superfamily hydrolase
VELQKSRRMKAAIFDIDGTLVDSVDLHAKAWQRAFAHFGHDIPFDSIRSQIGKGGDQLMPVFLSGGELESMGKDLEKYRGDLFRSEYLPEVRAFPCVRELFQRLLRDNWKLALASSAKGRDLRTYKQIAGIDDLLDAETSSDDTEKSKPHPDILQAAMNRLGGIAPKDCIVVGDSPYDAEASVKAGIRAVGFRCGGFPDSDLREAGCLALYSGPEDLLANYDSSVFFTAA